MDIKRRINEPTDIIRIQQALPHLVLPKDQDLYRVLGYYKPDGSGYLIAAITDYNGISCEVSGMATGKWFHTSIYPDLFSYIFDKNGCKRINFIVDDDNHKCINLLERGGCVFECKLRGTNRLLYSMTDEDYRKHYGQAIEQSAKTA